MKGAVQQSPAFLKFGTQNTRRNLPRASKRTESNFLRAFERYYMQAEAGTALAKGREFGVEGFGCADLILLAWRRPTGGDFTALALKRCLRLTAIEGKVADWRKGLQQAFRYRYFAHRALLVLPMRTAQTAAAFLPTFRKLRVGLWGFDSKTGRLRKWCTPRARTPLSTSACERALQVLVERLDFTQLSESV
jgi:hypothetical protein